MNIKTKITAVITALIMLSAFIPQLTFTASAEEIITISNSEEMKDFIKRIENGNTFSESTIKLTADITLSEYEYIGIKSTPFRGTFDGGGHKLIKYGSAFGAFGYSYGTIKNVEIVRGEYLVEYNYGTVINCCNTTSRSGWYGYMGVVKYNYGTITNCYNSGAISGFCGITYYNRGTITNCYNSGAITGDVSCGGIADINQGTITNCYNSGKLSGGTYYKGAVAAQNYGKITNCYYLDTCGAAGEGTSKTAAQFASGEVAYLLQQGQSNQVWYQTIGKDASPVLDSTHQIVVKEDNKYYGYPIELKKDSDGYYLINDKWGLYTFAVLVNNGETNAKAKLTADITLNKNVLKADGSLNSGSFSKWILINSFSGVFDGQGHSISGLYINYDKYDNEYIGMFCHNSGTIKNLCITDSYVYAYEAGGICGENKGTIENCVNRGTVFGIFYTGGICAYNYRGVIGNCLNIGNIINKYDGLNNGGICGYSLEYPKPSYNNYYLDTASNGSGNGTSKTAAELASGEVAWLLQNGQSSQVWGQEIGTDAYPVLTSDTNKSVYKAAFVYNGGKSEYAAQYQNAGGKFTVPGGEPSQDGFIFKYWSTASDGNTQYKGTDNVTSDITVNAVGRAKYGKSNVEKLISTTYGEFSEQNNVQDLSVYTAYACDISTAGKFNYSIVSVDKDGEAFDYLLYIFIPDINLINRDALFVMSGTPVGTYTVTIEATEKEPVASLMSVDYGTEPFTFTVTVTVNKGKPEYKIPQNLSADYGQILSDVELPEGFEWADGTQSVGGVGTNVFEAIYTPEDTESYNIVSVSVAVTVNPIAEERPEAAVDYENETLTGLVPNASYSLNNTDAEATSEGTLSIQKYIGKTVTLVRKASDVNHSDSEPLKLVLPARPSAPGADVFEVTQPSDVMGLIGSIGGISDEMEYSSDYGTTWTHGTGENIGNIESGTIYIIRYLAEANAFKSNPYAISINVLEPEQEPTPEISIDYENELLTGFDPEGVYLINGELLTGEGDGGITESTPIQDEYIGQTISIVRIGWINSEPQLLEIPERPEMPAVSDFEVTQPYEETAAETEDVQASAKLAGAAGAIGGITSNMEYSTDYGETWTDGTGEEIGNIEGGTTYSVRIKATDDSFKSMSNVISINLDDAEPEPMPEISIDYENELLTGFDPEGVYLINGELLTVEGEGSITEAMPLNGEYIGHTICIVRIGWVNSEPQFLEIPPRPSAPSEESFEVTQPSEVMELTGAIEGITADMEYSVDYGKTWTDGTGEGLEDIESGTTFSIRTKASESSFSSMTYIISIINKEPKQEETPEISVDYENRALIGFDPNEVYLINGELLVSDDEGSITESVPIKDEYFGQTISIIRIGMINSEPQYLTVADCPAMPRLIAVNRTGRGASDGKITGADSRMEYKADGGEWTDVQGAEITGLSDGEYTVRIKATENSFAGDAVTVTVGTDTATVIFVDYNGSVLQAGQVEKGTMPEYNGDVPSRPHDDIYSYVFSGWSEEIAEVSEDVVYEAQYTSVLRECGIEYLGGKAVVYVPEDSSCSVIFAAYDEDGVLTNVQTVTNILEAGTSIVTPGGFDTEGAAVVKVMLWDGLDSIKPLCNNYEMQL